MSYLLKELEAGKNQDGLQELLRSVQGLERGHRRSRLSSEQQYSETPSIPITPERRDRESIQPATPKDTLPQSSSVASTPKSGKEKAKTPSKPKIKLNLSAHAEQQLPQVPTSATFSSPGTGEPTESPSMASQRNRPARGGPRGGTNDLTEEKDLWDQIRPLLATMIKAEVRAAEVNKEIFDDEVQKKEKLNAGISMLLINTQSCKESIF
jgi:SAGA-associated factor 29